MTPYEQRNKDIFLASNGQIGLAIKLHDGTLFYSRGFYGSCDRCHRSTKFSGYLQPFREVKDGVIRAGWRCQ